MNDLYELSFSRNIGILTADEQQRLAGSTVAIVGLVGVATAQTPAPPQAATGPAVASPTYTSIPLEIAVNRPAADVWKRVGKFCDIGEWLQIPCTITQGKEVYALVKAGPNLYRVRRGMYLGQNLGVITSIDDTAINLRELVQDSGGEWVERESALPLMEAKK